MAKDDWVDWLGRLINCIPKIVGLLPRFIGVLRLGINTIEPNNYGKRRKTRGNTPKQYEKQPNIFGKQLRTLG